MNFLVPSLISLLTGIWFDSGQPDIRNLDFIIYLYIAAIFIAVAIVISYLYLAFAVFAKLSRRKSKLFGAWNLLFFNLLMLTAATGVILATYVFKHPVISYNYPAVDQAMLNYNEGLIVEFNVPVRIDKLKPSSSPQLKGEWVWEKFLGNDNLTQKGTFRFEETLLPNTRVVAYIAGINKLTDTKEHEYGFVSYSVSWPKILSTFPAEGSENVQRTDVIDLKLDVKNSHQVVDWNFTFTPAIDFTVDYSNEDIVRIVPSQNLTQGEDYKLNIGMRSKKINLKSNTVVEYGSEVKVGDLKFTVAKEPLLSEFKPKGNQVKADEKIQVTFQTEMDKTEVENNLVIEPAIEGSLIWENDKKFVFTPTQPLSKAKKFKVTIKKGIHSKFGGILENDIVSEFTTIGKVKVVAMSPSNNSGYVSEYANIEITFDQDVDRSSALSKIQISPRVDYSANWEGKKLTLNPKSNLSLDTTYNITIKSGVKTVYGLDSNSDYKFKFSTRPNQVVFTIPVYFQPSGFACNIFTAKMIMGWKGVGNPSHVALIAEAGYNPNRSGDHWTGNPYTEYVGNADGSWGYGAYYPVIQQLLANRGIASTPHTGWNMSSMAHAIQKGHPVIIWRYNGLGSAANISWTASDGTYVYAFDGMHGSVISGFIGPADNPSSFYINDPWLGAFWISAGDLDYYWSFSNRMALEVL
jgi:uncharacterized protein YvpB